LITRHPFRWWELLPWLASIGFYFALADYLGFGAELLVAILFALSLDLALGYAGIITLGHANISSTPVGGEARRVVVVREWWGAPLRGPLRRVAHTAIAGSRLIMLQ
jgi:branched-chain amino acid transport system permease protein